MRSQYYITDTFNRRCVWCSTYVIVWHVCDADTYVNVFVLILCRVSSMCHCFIDLYHTCLRLFLTQVNSLKCVSINLFIRTKLECHFILEKLSFRGTFWRNLQHYGDLIYIKTRTFQIQPINFTRKMKTGL